MLSRERIEELVDHLESAVNRREAVRPITAEEPGIDVDAAYRIQARWAARKVAAGRRIRGKKIGLTSRAMQQIAGTEEPDYGVLLDDMFFDDGSRIEIDRFIAPLIETEICFIMATDLRGPDCCLSNVLASTAFISPCMEIVDSRLQLPTDGTPRRLPDTIADNAACAGVIVGGRPARPFDVDMRWISAICYRNELVEETGVAAGVLNHPGNGVAWLVRKLALHGDYLRAGDIVLSGSFTRLMAIARGDTYHCDYGPLGVVSCRFV